MIMSILKAPEIKSSAKVRFILTSWARKTLRVRQSLSITTNGASALRTIFGLFVLLKHLSVEDAPQQTNMAWTHTVYKQCWSSSRETRIHGMFRPAFCLAFLLAPLPLLAGARLTWGTTKFLFTFGDSYTTDGFNISAGVNSPVPGFVRIHIVLNTGNWSVSNDV